MNVGPNRKFDRRINLADLLLLDLIVDGGIDLAQLLQDAAEQRCWRLRFEHSDDGSIRKQSFPRVADPT